MKLQMVMHFRKAFDALGGALEEIFKVVPDGILVFFF